ncbi:hypothetical protein AVEN_102633-1 [Araneus ventricosus]|uniref:Uncharacterized protein n=1 Tax=Araneus ventricosus TaxID=182803 RepID=A0A4Y2BIJ6_ARAVE|nr:hypothetical protein AVEN_102633-1 [Araneus ventricosus]
MSRTTPELEIPSPSSRTAPTGWRLTTTCDLERNGSHTVESGFEPGILQPRSQDLASAALPCSCKLHGIHRPLSSTLAFKILLKPRRFLQS